MGGNGGNSNINSRSKNNNNRIGEKMNNEVTTEQVEYWLVKDKNEDKYEDALSKLTNLINEKWAGGVDTVWKPNSDVHCITCGSRDVAGDEYGFLFTELRDDILELWGEYLHDIKNIGEDA